MTNNYMGSVFYGCTAISLFATGFNAWAWVAALAWLSCYLVSTSEELVKKQIAPLAAIMCAWVGIVSIFGAIGLAIYNLV